MIKSISITNMANDTLMMELANPGNSGYLITNIEGLGPTHADIHLTDFGSMDGSAYTGARAENRNITFDIIFYEYTIGTDVAIPLKRYQLYKYFVLKQKVRFNIIVTDSNLPNATVLRRLYCYGYVETVEPTYFSSMCGVSVSIICPDPYWYSADGIDTAGVSGAVSLGDWYAQNPDWQSSHGLQMTMFSTSGEYDTYKTYEDIPYTKESICHGTASDTIDEENDLFYKRIGHIDTPHDPTHWSGSYDPSYSANVYRYTGATTFNLSTSKRVETNQIPKVEMNGFTTIAYDEPLNTSVGNFGISVDGSGGIIFKVNPTLFPSYIPTFPYELLTCGNVHDEVVADNSGHYYLHRRVAKIKISDYFSDYDQWYWHSSTPVKGVYASSSSASSGFIRPKPNGQMSCSGFTLSTTDWSAYDRCGITEGGNFWFCKSGYTAMADKNSLVLSIRDKTVYYERKNEEVIDVTQYYETIPIVTCDSQTGTLGYIDDNGNFAPETTEWRNRHVSGYFSIHGIESFIVRSTLVDQQSYGHYIYVAFYTENKTFISIIKRDVSGGSTVDSTYSSSDIPEGAVYCRVATRMLAAGGEFAVIEENPKTSAEKFGEYMDDLTGDNDSIAFLLNTPTSYDISDYVVYNEGPRFVPEGISFGEYAEYDTRIVAYDGDAPTGFTIELKIKGNANIDQIEIINAANGQTMYLDATILSSTPHFQPGDIITVNTKRGEKSAEILRASDGRTYNRIGIVSIHHDWIEMNPGTNVFTYIAYDSQHAPTSNVDITFKFRNIYLGA